MPQTTASTTNEPQISLPNQNRDTTQANIDTFVETSNNVKHLHILSRSSVRKKIQKSLKVIQIFW